MTKVAQLGIQSKADGTTYAGKTITATFDSSRFPRYGTYAGRCICPWSGHPQPQPGETWECRVLTDWGTGMLVAPLRRL